MATGLPEAGAHPERLRNRVGERLRNRVGERLKSIVRSVCAGTSVVGYTGMCVRVGGWVVSNLSSSPSTSAPCLEDQSQRDCQLDIEKEHRGKEFWLFHSYFINCLVFVYMNNFSTSVCGGGTRSSVCA